MTEPRTPRILAVCLGNICRSPTAEAAIRDAARRAGRDMEVESAGTGDWHVGEPPDPRMAAAAASSGLQLTGTATYLEPDALRDADLVLVMDYRNLSDVQRLAREHDIGTPVLLLRELDPLAGADLEVPDPYEGGSQGFLDVVEMCLRAADELVARIDELLGVPTPDTPDPGAQGEPAG